MSALAFARYAALACFLACLSAESSGFSDSPCLVGRIFPTISLTIDVTGDFGEAMDSSCSSMLVDFSSLVSVENFVAVSRKLRAMAIGRGHAADHYEPYALSLREDELPVFSQPLRSF